MKCPHCNQNHPDGMKYCPETGKLISSNSICSNCGASIPNDSVYCPDCGKPVSIRHSPGGNDYRIVDLGLSVKWAVCNLGSSSSTEIKRTYSLEDLEISGLNDGLLAHDIFHFFGRKWRLPSYAEWQELFSNCTSEYTTIDDRKGELFTGLNGNTIFLPAGILRTPEDPSYERIAGFYWSGTLEDDNEDRAHLHMFFPDKDDPWHSMFNIMGSQGKNTEALVRLVYDEHL